MPTTVRRCNGTRPAALLAALALAAACRSDAPTAAAADRASAQLQVINAAGAPVDVLVDGAVRVSALPAASLSPVLAVAAGGRRIELRPAGVTAGAAAQVTARAESLALVAAQASAGGALAAAALDDTAAVPALGTSKLRVLHLAPNARPTRVWVLSPGLASRADDFAAYGGVVDLNGSWPYGGSTSYFQGAPGMWDVVITPARTTGGWPGSPPTDSTGAGSRGSAGSGSGGPPAYAVARLLVPVSANVARTVVMLDAPGGGVRLEQTGAP